MREKRLRRVIDVAPKTTITVSGEAHPGAFGHACRRQLCAEGA